MLSTFWTGLSGKLADSWAGAILSPAFVFWLGGFFAWANHRQKSGFSAQVSELTNNLSAQSTPTQVLVIIVVLLTVTASALGVRALVPSILRTLEGYWPRPFRRFRHFLTERRSQRLDAEAARWRVLALGQTAGTLTLAELDDYATLDRKRRLAPLDPKIRMPTRLGNVLRTMETLPRDHYGLDAIVCWPRLWLVLPDTVRKEVTDSRRVLDQYAEIWLWAVLFLAWTPFSWWVPIGSIAVVFMAYRGMISAATVYGQLVVSCYDLHRFDLYASLKWSPPSSPEVEIAQGEALTAYLSRGLAESSVRFTTAGNNAGPHGAKP